MAGGLVTFAREELVERIGGAEGRVWLVSPFLTRPVAEQIAEAAERAGVPDRQLLTALNARSVQANVLDPKALSTLAAAGFEIRSITNLHAKVSLVDSSWGLVGSGNLTGAGLGGEEGGNYDARGAWPQTGCRRSSRRMRRRRSRGTTGSSRTTTSTTIRLGGLATGSAIGDRPHTGGYCSITRSEFETLARAMLAAAV